MEAVGVHVFAGGFTKGVKEAGFDVKCQLETHGFGVETAERTFGTPVVNVPHEGWDAPAWPDVKHCQFCYGNPRCTGFSCVTSGYGEELHGAWAKQTADIHQLCDYAAGRFDVVCWESVQQAYTTGRDLIEYLVRDVFRPRGYRVAHVKVNAASFGNPQNRRRYFFFAYRDDRNFNVVPPDIDAYYPVTFDALWDLRNREASEVDPRGEIGRDQYVRLSPGERSVYHLIPNGWSLNQVAPYVFDQLPARMQRMWRTRSSPMPFSMHCIRRANWLRPFATLTSSSFRTLHPDHDRPITLGEFCAIMGWGDDVAVGPKPFAQVAKGVVPAVGRWLAEQVMAYLRDDWGDEDWESTWNPRTGVWDGRSTHGQTEKLFDLTRYVGQHFDIERYPDEVRVQRHRLNVDSRTGRLLGPWTAVEESYRRHAGDGRIRCRVDFADARASAELP